MTRATARKRQTTNALPTPQPRVPTPHDIPLWPGLVAAALVGFVYLAVASQGAFHFRPSRYPHHVLIADAWLHGQLHVRDEIIRADSEQFYRQYRASIERKLAAQGQRLTEAAWEVMRKGVIPPFSHDWSVIDGKYYGYWGPMVPALLLPYVAVAGLQASDMLFSCVVGTGTVLLTFLMLRQAGRSGLIPMTAPACVALALVLGLGTVHFFLTVTGQVWFLSEIVATFFVTLAIYCILQTSEATVWVIAAGASLGAAFLARNSVLTTAPFFYCTLLAPPRNSGESRRQRIRSITAFSMPLVVAGVVALGYNYARFGDAFETGVRSQFLTNGNPVFRGDFLQYGAINLHYVPRNIYYYFLNPMLRHYPTTQAITFDPRGNSMFLVTPPLLYVLWSLRRRDRFTIAVWSGVLSSMTLLLLFQGSGWYGFGNRYLLDLMPLAILLIAIGMNGHLGRTALVLIGLSIIVNAWGTYRFTSEQF